MGGTGSGGPRTPAKPAPVSGPGRLSKRTDGGPGAKLAVPSGLPYGDRADVTAQERSAPMALDAPSVTGQDAPAPQAGGGVSPFAGVGLGAPSSRPNEPVTAGAGYGPGAGPEALSHAPTPQAGVMTQMLSKIAATDGSGLVAQLMQAAASRNL